MRAFLLLSLLLLAAGACDVAAQTVPRPTVGPCAGFYPSGFTPVVGKVSAPERDSPRPAKGEAFADPAFGTCVVRATDHRLEPPSGFARNDYSRRQAFNADQTRFIVYALDGAWHLYDATTLAHLRQLNGPAGDAEPQWHPTDPRKLYWLPTNGGLQMNLLDVETNTSAVAANFAGRLPWAGSARVLTRSEGSPSADARYWCFQVETNDFQILGVFTYDLQAQAITGSRSLASRPDHVSMSPSGRWCVVSQLDGQGGTVAWSRDFSRSLTLHGSSEHSDIAVGANGDDVFAFVDYQSNDGDLMMVDLDTGLRTALFPTYIDHGATAYHVSGKAFAAPGWILLSTYARTGVERWLHDRILAVQLRANPTIIQIAHHHSRETGYWAEPHASVSRDFSRVLFTSNWGATDPEDVDAYMVQLPGDVLTRATALSCPAP